MRNLILIPILVLSFFVLETIAQPPTAPKSLPGEVVTIDAANNQLKFKTVNGETTIAIDAKTEIKRIAPDKLSDPASAIAASLSDISVGDKIVAVGVLSDDKKTVAQTRRIFVLTRADLIKKQEADQARWTTRGIAGRVTVLDSAANTITVAVRGGFGGERTTIVTTSDKTVFRRYAANSVKFSDAKSSSLSELKVGDQLRAVGEKTSDNAALAAEEILFGSFRMIAGKVSAIDVAKNEITVKDLQTNKDVTIGVNGETLLRRFPAEMAQRMAQMQMMRGGGAAAGTGGGAPSAPGVNSRAPQSAGGQTALPPSANQNANDGMPSAAVGTRGGTGTGGGTGMRRGDVDSMLEQMPALVLTELKIGDAVAASSSVGESTDRVTAIKFVAGIEPFLIVPQPAAMPGGNRPQSSPSINIPGLDGFGAP